MPKINSNQKSMVSAEDFVRIWQTASSVDEVSEKTGISIDGAISRAIYYRKRGVQLRRFPKSKRKNDWAALAKLAGELGGNGTR